MTFVLFSGEVVAQDIPNMPKIMLKSKWNQIGTDLTRFQNQTKRSAIMSNIKIGDQKDF